MATDTNLYRLPEGLPEPLDDGGADGLAGKVVPDVRLRSTGGEWINVAEVAQRLSVFFFYPATIAPPAVIPGEWSEIPGARGCTVQTMGFRDAYDVLSDLGCEVFGVSGQGQDDPEAGFAQQLESKRRLGLPFDLLNDSRFELIRALGVPTFVATLRNPTVEFEGRSVAFPLQGRTLVKRLTFVANRGRIERVFYPVFPPDTNARDVVEYLHHRPAPGPS